MVSVTNMNLTVVADCYGCGPDNRLYPLKVGEIVQYPDAHVELTLTIAEIRAIHAAVAKAEGR